MWSIRLMVFWLGLKCHPSNGMFFKTSWKRKMKRFRILPWQNPLARVISQIHHFPSYQKCNPPHGKFFPTSWKRKVKRLRILPWQCDPPGWLFPTCLKWNPSHGKLCPTSKKMKIKRMFHQDKTLLPVWSVEFIIFQPASSVILPLGSYDQTVWRGMWKAQRFYLG